MEVMKVIYRLVESKLPANAEWQEDDIRLEDLIGIACCDGYKLTKSRRLQYYFPVTNMAQPAPRIWHDFQWPEQDNNLIQLLKQRRQINAHGRGKWNAFIKSARTPSGKKIYIRLSEELFNIERGSNCFVVPFDYYMQETIDNDNNLRIIEYSLAYKRKGI